MTYAIPKRAIAQPRRSENADSIRQLITAIGELGGSLGSRKDRAVRVGELLDAGYLEFKADGTLGAPKLTIALEEDGTDLVIDSGTTATGVARDIIMRTGGTDRARFFASTGTLSLNGITSVVCNPATLFTIGSQSGGGVGLLRLEQSGDSRMGFTKTGVRRWSIGNLDTDFSIRDESGAALRFYITSSGASVFFEPGSSPATSSIQISSPNSVPGIIAFHTSSLRRDIRFAADGIQLGASATSATPTTQLLIPSTAGATIRSWPNFDVRGADTHGYVRLTTGNTTNPGYLAFYTPDDVRRGYLGWAASGALLLHAENGYNWAFNVTGGHAGADWPTIGTKMAGLLELGFNTGWARGQVFAATASLSIGTGNAAGSTYYLYNNSAAAITITAIAGLTLRLGGTATTGNRTLAARGMALVWCVSTTEMVMFNLGGLT